MAVNGTSTETTVVGRVVSVNDKGFRLDGQSDWLNYSKFAVGIVPPSKGDVVNATLDRAGFVRSVQSSETSPGATRAPHAAHTASGAQRETTITRLAVLKAAAAFAASRPDATSADVLKVAASWESWVNRPPDELDLTDAF